MTILKEGRRGLSEISKDNVTQLLNVFLPDEDLASRDRPTTSSMEDINLVLYIRVMMLNSYHAALVKELHGKDDVKLRKKKKYLYFKLIREYNIALEILKRMLPLDTKIFFRFRAVTFVHHFGATLI